MRASLMKIDKELNRFCGRSTSPIHNKQIPALLFQACLIFYNPVDSGALQLNNDNVEMTLGRMMLGIPSINPVEMCN